MNNKRLSIIIPHYNSCELVKKLIDSIPTKEEIQIILVDDNSTQNTTELQEYAKTHRVEFYKNDSSVHSAGRCRNIGLQHAVGEWLLFADADDFFLEGFYDIICPYFEKEYDIVYFAPTSMKLSDGTESNRHISICNLIQKYVAVPVKENEIQLRYEHAVPFSKIVRGSIVRENNLLFDETRVANDVMFSMRCAVHAKKIQASEQVIYCITKSEGTLTTSVKREDARMRMRMAVKKYKYLRKHVDKETWRMLDLRGDRYTKLFKRYKMDRRDKVWAWSYMLVNGVRPCISRQASIKSMLGKIVGKVFKKN